MKSAKPRMDPNQSFQAALRAYGNGEYAQAAGFLRPLVARMPGIAEAHHLLGVCQYMNDNLVDAERSIRKALSIAKNEEFYANLGLVLQQAGKPDAAADAYRSSLKLQSKSAKVCNNLGNILSKLNQLEEAIGLYRRAVSLEPNYAIGHKNLGSQLLKVKVYGEAEESLARAISLDPGFDDAKEVLADLFIKTERHEEAFAIYRSIGSWAKLQHEMRKVASWSSIAEVDRACLGRSVGGLSKSAPWCLLQIEGITPELEKRAAREFAVQEIPELKAPALCAANKIPFENRPLRIGYLSSDFYGHATMHLLAGVFEVHDRATHDITLFSYAPEKNDEFVERLKSAKLEIVNIAGCSESAAAQEILRRNIDILVDLKGYTTSARLGITALRPAPIIVSWLGYPGTLGHERLADYIIGDPVVTPAANRSYFSERLALMPICYQPNDAGRPLPEPPLRSEMGLPDTGLVFCSFNQTLKFNPQTFDHWARLLLATPCSVLWLLRPDSALAQANILREFQSRGVPTERIIFAPFASQAEHIGRLRLADIALDTFPCNSHTTASDALWAGVPLVTRVGETFAGRVAASLLSAHGFPDLITRSEDQYLALVLDLATNDKKRLSIRAALEAARKTSPLFDTMRFTKDLEAMYREIIADWRRPSDQRPPVVSLT